MAFELCSMASKAEAVRRAWKLARLPYVPAADEVIARGRKAARREHARARTPAAEVDLHTQALARELRSMCDSLPPPDSLTSFERAIVALSLDGGLTEYDSARRSLHKLRKNVVSVGKSSTSAVKSSAPKSARAHNGATQRNSVSSAIEDVRETLRHETHTLEHVKYAVQRLKQVPLPALDEPLAALIGAPNVGKSSLVHCLSSGNPSIQNYPFTTRGFLLGHMQPSESEGDGNVWLQVADTPGLLKRGDNEERNRLECMTLAVLEHLPSVAVYVLDLTGRAGCGMSVSDQLSVRNEVRHQFPCIRWIDVFSKADVAPTDPEDAIANAEELLRHNGSASEDEAGDLRSSAEALRLLGGTTHMVSAHEGGGEGSDASEETQRKCQSIGISELRCHVERELMYVRENMDGGKKEDRTV